MPSWWCGPRLRVPKWVGPRITEARTSFRTSFRRRVNTLQSPDNSFRRRIRTLNENDLGSRFRNSLRRSRRSMSMRNLNRNRNEGPLRRTASLNFKGRNGTSVKDSTMRRRRSAADIRVIRRSFCASAVADLNNCCSTEDRTPEEIELDEMTKQADNLRREYEQMQFQEKWRDDLLFKLHQENHNLSPPEMELAAKARSFTGVKGRGDSLLDQIRVLIRKFLILAQGDPNLVEVCFQIVQEEERRDEEAIERVKEDGFETPDRPKKWKDKVLIELRKVPLLRVENTPQDDRSMDRNWLAKHMELMSQKLREDLNVVKLLFNKCPDLDTEVAQFFVDAYYECLTQHIQDIVSTGLRHNEIIQLLIWLKEHRLEMQRVGPAFVKSVSLEKAADNLIPDHTKKELEQSYLKKVRNNVKQWAKDALQKEQEDWQGDDPPKHHQEGFLYTDFPVHLFSLLRENLEVASKISAATCNALKGYCLDEVRNTMQQYAAAVKFFIPTRSVSTSPPPSPQPSTKSKQLVKKIRQTVEPHLSPMSAEEKRSMVNKPKFYVQFSVAALNNFETIIEHSDLLNQQRNEAKKSPAQAGEEEDDFTYSLNVMRRLAKECLDKFMTDMYAELKPLLRQVGTKQWFAQNSTSSIGELCDVITAFAIQLRKGLLGDDWREKLEHFILQEYLKGFIRKTACITCKNSKERRDVAEQISWESEQMENTLASLVTQAEAFHISQFSTIRQVAEVIQLNPDKATLILEISSLVLKHPELTRRQIKAMLRLRGDLKKSKIKKILADSMAQDDDTDSIGYGSGESTVTVASRKSN